MPICAAVTAFFCVWVYCKIYILCASSRQGLLGSIYRPRGIFNNKLLYILSIHFAGTLFFFFLVSKTTKFCNIWFQFNIFQFWGRYEQVLSFWIYVRYIYLSLLWLYKFHVQSYECINVVIYKSLSMRVFLFFFFCEIKSFEATCFHCNQI